MGCYRETAQPRNKTTDSCSESFVDDKTLCSDTPAVSVSLQCEPRVSVSQRARNWPNILLGEALLHIKQQKLDYLNSNMQGNRKSFTMRMSVFPESTA
jgi:hypothetical protein